MKKAKKLLSAACAVMMLMSVSSLPTSAETIDIQEDTSPTLTIETLQANNLNAYVNYGQRSYVKVSPGGSARSLVTSQKKGAHSSLAEHTVQGLKNVDELAFQIQYKGTAVTDEYWGGAGDEMDMYYEDTDFAGTVKLVARNYDETNTAQVKGRIQFN